MVELYSLKIILSIKNYQSKVYETFVSIKRFATVQSYQVLLLPWCEA
jgi:hypothetical protein